MSEDIFLEEIGVVKEVHKDSITVTIQRNEGCKSCGMSSFCGTPSDKTVEHIIKTDKKYKVDDKLRIQLQSGLKILSSFIVFIIPIILMILSYLLSKTIFSLSENFSILISILSLIPSALIIKLLNDHYSKKIMFEILGKVE